MVRRTSIIIAAIALVGGSSARALVLRDETGKPARGGENVGCGTFAVSEELRAKTAAPFGRRETHVRYNSPFGTFRFHYDTTGVHAIPMQDTDANGRPDWVDAAAQAADSVRKEYGNLGYFTNLGDGGIGGNTRYDIYFSNQSNPVVYGYTHSGENGFIELDNDYSDASAYVSLGADGLRVSLAHEMFHAIQFVYLRSGYRSWWLEMTATFMEDVMYDAINDYYQYLNPLWFNGVIFQNPSAGITYDNGTVHPYSAAVFPHFLREKYGDAAMTAVRATFETAAADDATIIRTITNELGTPMSGLLAEFWIWSYFTGDRARPSQFFEEGANYGPAPLDSAGPQAYRIAGDRATIRNLASVITVSGADTTAFLGAQFIRIVPDRHDGSIRMTFDPQGRDWSWRVAVVKPDTVLEFTPATLSGPTRQQQFIVEENDLTAASEIIVAGANGETTPGRYSFGYVLEYQRPVGIAAHDRHPARTVLGQNAPNPFNPSTSIPVFLDVPTTVSLAIYDATGRPVRGLARDLPLGAGQHVFTWDGTTDAGLVAGTGVYIIQLVTPLTTQARRMVLLR